MKPPRIAPIKVAVFPLLWVACLHLFTMYDGRRNLCLVDEMTTLTMGSALAMISLSGVLFLTARETARSLFLVFVLSAFVYSAAWRMAARIYLRVFPQAVKNRHLLILGAGVTGRKMEQRIQASRRDVHCKREAGGLSAIAAVGLGQEFEDFNS